MTIHTTHTTIASRQGRVAATACNFEWSANRRFHALPMRSFVAVKTVIPGPGDMQP